MPVTLRGVHEFYGGEYDRWDGERGIAVGGFTLSLRDQLEWKTAVAELLDRYIRTEEEFERKVGRQVRVLRRSGGRRR
jgi:hypothetical protein